MTGKNSIYSRRETVNLILAEKTFRESIDSSTIANVEIIIKALAHPIDVGARCYLLRKKSIKYDGRQNPYQFLVDTKSVSQHRLRVLCKFLNWVDEQHSSGIRPITIRRYFLAFLSFLDWCDLDSEIKPNTDRSIVTAFGAYTEAQWHKVQTGELTQNTANGYVAPIRKMLMVILEDSSDEIRRIPRIYKNNAEVKHAVPPTHEDATRYQSILKEFIHVSNLFVKQEIQFPFQASIGGAKHSFFPSRYHFCTHAKPNATLSSGQHTLLYAYNQMEGRLSTVEEVISLINFSCKNKNLEPIAKEKIRRAKARVASANSNPLDFTRIRMTRMCIFASAMLFISLTGINLAQLASMRLSDLTFKKNGFLTVVVVKERASKRKVRYSITKRHSRYFDNYLKVRKIVLKQLGYGDEKLVFFDIIYNRPKELPTAFTQLFHRYFCHFIDPIEAISPKQWRAFKGGYHSTKQGIVASSNALQNSPSTAVKNYTTPNLKTANDELTLFFGSYEEQLFLRAKENAKEVNVGQCVQSNTPKKGDASFPISPDCVDDAGCLFCDKFRIHSDRQDVKKLLSYQAVLDATRHLRDNEVYNNQYYETVRSRIDFLLSAVVKTGGLNEKEVQKERECITDDGILSPFWASKMDMFISVGLIW